MGETLNGHLEFFSETGTEGGTFMFYHERPDTWHRFDEPCFDKWDDHCPTKMRELEDKPGHFNFSGTGKRSTDFHANYDGLVSFEEGDYLAIEDTENGGYLWEGTPAFRKVDSWGPEGGIGGLRVHEHPEFEGAGEYDVLLWFLRSHKAVLVRADT